MSFDILTKCPAYCVQLWCRDVREDNGIREDYAATVFCGELGVAHSNDVRAVMNTKTNTLSMIKSEVPAAVLRRVAHVVLPCRWTICSTFRSRHGGSAELFQAEAALPCSLELEASLIIDECFTGLDRSVPTPTCPNTDTFRSILQYNHHIGPDRRSRCNVTMMYVLSQPDVHFVLCILICDGFPCSPISFF